MLPVLKIYSQTLWCASRVYYCSHASVPTDHFNMSARCEV